MEKLTQPPTTKAPPELFTGDVWFDVIYQGEGPSRMRCNSAHFSPSSRTAWHRHAVGQTLHVTEGIGLVQTRGGKAIVMRPGDTVHPQPGEWHWHGASFFTADPAQRAWPLQGEMPCAVEPTYQRTHLPRAGRPVRPCRIWWVRRRSRRVGDVVKPAAFAALSNSLAGSIVRLLG